ncbi:MAG: nuclear transport factor 2 family protein [Saprospiraceae bacterium]
MKKIVMILTIALTAVTSSFSQSMNAKNAKVEAQIIALEQAAWQAWKNNDATWVQMNSAEEFLSVNAEGVSTKAEVLASIPKDCKIKSFSLSDFTFAMTTKNTAHLTYIANEDGMCDGEKIPSKVRVGVTYIKRHGKWHEAFYVESTIEK